jgi:hypothetical protein
MRTFANVACAGIDGALEPAAAAFNWSSVPPFDQLSHAWCKMVAQRLVV